MRIRFAIVLLLVGLASPTLAVTIETVPIGNPGNQTDPAGWGVFGRVDYNYRMSVREVTNAQYAEFLNAKAKSDPFGLYNADGMGSFLGTIHRSGSNGSYSYTITPGMENRPVVYVNWYDCLRFANWVNNGQGNGDTENGAYTMNGYVPNEFNLNGPNIPRNPGASWFLPTLNEWYKAAYYDPTTQTYFRYPTSSNTAPTAEAPSSGSNSANYLDAVGTTTNVGSYPNSRSPYGTLDQGGNIEEFAVAPANNRQPWALGGTYWAPLGQPQNLNVDGFVNPFGSAFGSNASGYVSGFRLAAVPEPSTWVLAACGALSIAAFRYRQQRRRACGHDQCGDVNFTTKHFWGIGMRIRFAILLLLVGLASPALAVTIETVPIGNPGNPSDPANGWGTVNYNYRMATYEVTNAQYVEFLNAKAASDPFALFNTEWQLPALVGITRSGVSGSYTYALVPGMENKPVLSVNYYDCLRFANWMQNGQGNGDTESGAYTLLGGTRNPTNGPIIHRNADARWFLPNLNEWDKAAYYDPTTNTHFTYPTASNTAPTPEAPAGGANSANYAGVLNQITDVGAYVNSPSPYGTFDQAGNAWEWGDAIGTIPWVYFFGGTYQNLLNPANNVKLLQAGFLDTVHVQDDELDGNFQGIGFRLATVPEPSTWALAACGALAIAAFRWRRQRRR